MRPIFGHKKSRCLHSGFFKWEICGLPAAGSGGATFFSLVDTQGATAKINAIQAFNGFLGISFVHFNKAKATGTACFAVHDKLDVKGIAVRGEKGLNAFLGSGKGKIADVDRNGHNDSVVEVGKLSA